MEAKPDITAKVYLVPIGYQIDIFDSKGKEIASVCRDFGGKYSSRKLKNYTTAAMIVAMRDLEKSLIKTEPQNAEKKTDRMKTMKPAITFSKWSGQVGSQNAEQWDDGFICEVLLGDENIGFLRLHCKGTITFDMEIGKYPNEMIIHVPGKKIERALKAATSILRKYFITPCVKHKEGWCAVKPGHKATGEDNNVPTLCEHYIVLNYGVETRVPTCNECLRAIEKRMRVNKKS